MGKWDSASTGTEGGIPSTSASYFCISFKASFAISVNASFINCNLTAGMASFTGASLICTGASAAFTGASSASVGYNAEAKAAETNMEVLVNRMTSVESYAIAFANEVRGVKTNTVAVENNTAVLQSTV